MASQWRHAPCRTRIDTCRNGTSVNHFEHGGRAAMSDDIDFHLGKRMRRRRRLLGLTQQQLAEACGVRFQQIQKYECGANRVSAARLWRISEALEVPVNYFFEGLTDKPPLAARDEPAELVRGYHALGERPRRRLVNVARSLNRDNDAA